MFLKEAAVLETDESIMCCSARLFFLATLPYGENSVLLNIHFTQFLSPTEKSVRFGL